MCLLYITSRRKEKEFDSLHMPAGKQRKNISRPKANKCSSWNMKYDMVLTDLL
jgi:hypothetical protein